MTLPALFDGLRLPVAGDFLALNARPAAGDVKAMDFSSKKQAWRDIRGSGQGVGAIRDVVPVAALVDRLARAYAAARDRLGVAA